MFKIKLLQSILLSGCFCFITPELQAQNAEVRLLRKINPTVPDSKFWIATTNSSKPVSVGLPVAMFATGLIIKDKNLQQQAIETLGSFAVTTGVTLALKNTIKRPRPYERYTDIHPDHLEDGRSFPSGHTSVAFSTATSVSIHHKQWYVIVPAYAWATAVGYSRLYLGQHHPTDIIGGAITGAGSAWLTHKANKWLRKK